MAICIKIRTEYTLAKALICNAKVTTLPTSSVKMGQKSGVPLNIVATSVKKLGVRWNEFRVVHLDNFMNSVTLLILLFRKSAFIKP